MVIQCSQRWRGNLCYVAYGEHIQAMIGTFGYYLV